LIISKGVKGNGLGQGVEVALNLRLIVNYDNLGLKEPFQGTCFGHAMSKVSQYGIMDEEVFAGLHEMSIKSAQVDFQMCITWPKKLGKGC